MEKSYAAKNIVLGLIGLVWGGMVLFNHFTGHRPPPGNASYEAGVTAALVLAECCFWSAATRWCVG